MVDRRQHWETVYDNKTADRVSWFQLHAASSLRLIEGCADKDAHIIDVGGGASVLVDDLLDAGYRNLTVLDLAESALAASRARLGARHRRCNGSPPTSPGPTCRPHATTSGTTARCSIS